MTQYIDAAELLADVRRKRERVDEIARRARLKLGVQTASRGEVYRDTSDRPLAWLFDGQDPDVVVRDSRTLKSILHVFKMTPRLRRSSARSIIQLSNGRSVRFHPQTGEVTPNDDRGL
jgi:hypothetical protein